MSVPKSDPKLIALASRDPVVFISYYSGLQLQEFQCNILYAVEKYSRIIVLLPCTMGKSTLLSLWYVVYKIAQNRNVRIILLMKNDDELKQYARAIRSVLAGNHQLIRDFGRFAPSGKDVTWSNEALIVDGRQIHDPQPTVLFASANTIDQALGKRCDIFVGDDFVTPTTVSTPQQRNKQAAIFNEGIETSPQYIWDRDPETGKLLVPAGIDWPQDIEYEKGILCGTVFHPDDLFHRKIGRVADMPHGKVVDGLKDPAYVAIKYDCWTDAEKTKPLWPGRWPAEKLRLKERSMGRLEFDKRFRNIAVDEGSMVFKQHWFYGERIGDIEYPGCLDYTRRIGDVPDGVNLIVLGLDPSTGRTGRRTSFTAAVVLGIDTRENPPRRYVIDLYRAQMGYDDIISLITFGDERTGIPGMYDLYHYGEGRIETVAAQSYLVDNARMKEAGYKGVRVVPHETQRNKTDPLTGVASMQSIFKDGLVSIPYHNDPSTRERVEEFIDEMLMFPDGQGTHDYPMAFWFAELSVRKRGSGYVCMNAGPGQRVVNPRFG